MLRKCDGCGAELENAPAPAECLDLCCSAACAQF